MGFIADNIWYKYNKCCYNKKKEGGKNRDLETIQFKGIKLIIFKFKLAFIIIPRFLN